MSTACKPLILLRFFKSYHYTPTKGPLEFSLQRAFALPMDVKGLEFDISIFFNDGT